MGLSKLLQTLQTPPLMFGPHSHPGLTCHWWFNAHRHAQTWSQNTPKTLPREHALDRVPHATESACYFMRDAGGKGERGKEREREIINDINQWYGDIFYKEMFINHFCKDSPVLVQFLTWESLAP